MVMAVIAAASSPGGCLLQSPMPDFYFQRPTSSAYVLWWLAKLLHYLTATVWLSPMTIGPSGRYHPWTEVPGDCVLMVAILAIMSVGYYTACRGFADGGSGQGGFWRGCCRSCPSWPHLTTAICQHRFAIAMTLAPAAHETRPTSVGRWCAGVAIWFLIATTTYMPIYRPMWYSMLAASG